MLLRSRRQTALHRIIAGGAVVLMIFVGLLVAVAATLTSPASTDPATGEPTDFAVIQVGLGMLVLLTLPWYRRVPLLPMIVGAVAATVLRLDPFVLAVGLTVWVVRCRQRWQWAVAGVGLGLIVINVLMHLYGLSQWPDDDYTRTGQLLVISLGVLCIGLVLGISLWVRQKHSADYARATAQKAQHSSEQLSDELVRQREREDLAREVHDTLAGRLSGLSLQVGSLEDSAQRGDNTQLDDALRTTRSYADQALTDLRVLLTSLREGGASTAAPVKTLTGVADLQNLLEDAAAAGLEIRPYILLDGYASAPQPLQRAVLRIAQEALTNALRHSADRQVQVNITGDPERGIQLEFRNRSNGSSQFAQGSGTGIIGVRERAELLGGSVDVLDASGEFRLTVVLPWPAPTAQE